MKNTIYPMSDNWWIEGKKAFFCGIVANAIFCVDLDTQICELIAWIPECNIIDFRQYPYCIKRGESIFCLPGTGKCIWCYDMRKNVWEKIEVPHEGQYVLYHKFFNRNFSDIIWLLEYDTGTISVLNLEKKLMEREYHISGECGEYVFVQDKMYCVVDNTVQCISLNGGEWVTYEVIGASGNLYTICYDGVNFWMSGYYKEIYVWNPEQGMIKVITDFPQQFGVYHFHTGGEPYVDYNVFYNKNDNFFNDSVIVGKYVWYIPSQSSSIIYIDKETYKVNMLDIPEEWETRESLQRDYCCKYLLEYIREERYIGLYSIKNHSVFEIDTVKLCIENREYELSDDTVLSLAKACGYYKEPALFNENRKMDVLCFQEKLKQRYLKNTEDECQNVGMSIYLKLCRNKED